MAASKKTASKKTNGKKSKKSSSNPKSTSTAKKKAAARAEWEAQRNRFITAIVQVLLSVLLLFVCFMPGENLWLEVHKFYCGVFGIFGFVPPALIIYCSIQNFKDVPTYNFKLKTLLFSLVTLFLSTTVFCFQTGEVQMSAYFEEIVKSYTYAIQNAGTGVLGAALGIPLKMAAGAIGGGIISITALIITLAFALDSVLVSIFEAFKTPAKIVGEHISDNREIRSEVKRREKQIKEEKRLQTRKQYVENEIDKRIRQKHPSDDDKFCRIKNRPFYEPDTANAVKKRKTETKKDKTKKETEDETKESALPISEQDISVYPDAERTSEQYFPDDELLTAQDIGDVHVDPPTEKLHETATEPTERSEKTQKKNKTDKSDSDVFEIDTDNSVISGHYIKPPFSLLEPQPDEKESNLSAELNQRGKILTDTLKSFGVQATVVNISRGPAVTRYELQPASGVKISKITNLADDIALNLAATRVRIEAPIPGKSAVGIEVPNKTVTIVKMRNLVESREFQNAKSKLTVALGVDIAGKITLADLGKMPHLLIAGSTGSGKSVCVNSMLISLLYKSSPDEVKLLLIDPKVVELGIYNGIPHLLVPVVTDPRKAAGALGWAVNEMLNRYKLFAEYNVRDMHGYNRFVESRNAEADENAANDYHSDMSERSFEEDEMLAQAQSELGENVGGEEDVPEPKKLQKMPHIVIVIDELADLMMAASKEVEESICRLAQMARAAGMHLVIATQRPSVDVITGLIKANVPSRIAFAVKSVTDSRTILDTGGADKLMGRGDMLFSPIGTTKPIRVQGCFVDDSEINNIIDFIKKNKVVEYDENVIEEIERNAVPENNSGDDDAPVGERDPMIEEAIRCVVEAGQASTSMLQRRLRLGYARAGRIIDEMEQMGIVGPHEGAKPRKVLMTYQEYTERMLNNSDN